MIAHRGGPPAGVPENSLEAFAGALAVGADMVELDVRRTADGRLVVFHDRSAAGLTVRRASLAALRSASGYEILELGAVVEFAAGRIGLDVELKETGYEHEVIAALEPSRGQGRPLLVTSFFAAAAGVPAIPWTLNAPADLELAFGHEAVAGVITDLPELALQVRSGQVLD